MRKRIAAIVMALMLTLGISISGAFADTITISVNGNGQADGNNASETYYAYKIFDVIKKSDVNGNNSDGTLSTTTAASNEGYNYSISTSSQWWSLIAGTAGDGTNGILKDYITLTTVAGDSTLYSVKLTSASANTAGTAKAMADILYSNISGKTADATISDNSKNAPSAVTVAAGYYLITSSLGNNLILATTNINLTEKNTYPTIAKTADKKDMSIGDTITYTITVKVPSTVTNDIVIYEEMADVLKKTTVTAKNGTNDVAYTESTSTADSTIKTNKWTWTFKKEALQGMFTNAERNNAATITKDLVITMTAKLLDTAAADTEYINKAHLTYSNYQNSDVSVGVKTFDFDIQKTDGTNNLTGAEFQLRTNADSAATAIKFTKSGNNYVRIDGEVADEGDSKIEAGAPNINGLGHGTYYLVETKSPEGYNRMNAPVTIEIDESGNTTIGGSASGVSVANNKVTVVNNAGILLPSTGSIGQILLYAGGVIILLASFLYFFVNRKKNNAAK